MYNTQYPLLLNQHNGDDATQDCLCGVPLRIDVHSAVLLGRHGKSDTSAFLREETLLTYLS